VEILDFKRSIQCDSYTCGVHSVAMIVRYFGYSTPFKELKRELNCTPARGTPVHAMIKAMRSRRLRVRHNYRMRFRELQASLRRRELLLVHLDGDHFGVVHGFDSQFVYLADPSIVRLIGRKMTHTAFRKRWTNWSLAVWSR
jgi:ABC-type bacteriocin/lantibiotic exporter with double-glycine peptidase domain